MDEHPSSAQGAARDPRFFEALFEQALDSLLVADDERRYVEVNPAACELIGRAREEVIGHCIEEFFEVEPDERVPQAWKKFRSEGVQSGICRAIRPDGSVRYASYQARAGFWPGLNLSILHDITDQRATAEALDASRRELEIGNAELTRSNAELNNFAYAVGHDLNAPLRSIKAFTNLLASRIDPTDADAREYVQYIQKAAAGMSGFLHDLLDYAQVRRIPEPMRRVDTAIVLDWAVANLHAAIAANEAVITRDELPSIVANERHVSQLFQNLIGNSLKYRTEETPRVHVTAVLDSEVWLFSISDNGIGIPPEHHADVFDIFKRLHGSDVPGSGVGLALCKRIVENHGGRIWVESQPGSGSTFRFTIPA